MKTYALYLLMLCFSVIGCQKDIPSENDPALKKGKTNLKYLPTEMTLFPESEEGVDSTKLFFSYLNDEGDLSSIDISSYFDSRVSFYGYTFDYKSNKLHTVNTTDQGSDLWGPPIYTFSFNTDKASGYRTENLAGYVDPFWPTEPPDENGEYPPAPIYWDLVLSDSTEFVWSNNRLISFKNHIGKLNFSYVNGDLASINPESPSSFELMGATTYTYDNKNYWGKNIKNKDILMLILSSILHPIDSNPSKICIKKKDSYDVEILETFDYKGKFNEDGYPTEICETRSGIRFNTHEAFKNKITYKIKYKTIPQLN